MGAATSGAGLLTSMVGSYLSNKRDNKLIKKQNRADEAAWDDALNKMRDQLTIAYERTQTGIQEINRDRINKKIAIRKSVRSAEGTANVQSAQLGISGRRGSSAAKSIVREGLNQESEVNIDAEIEETNAINTFNDAAESAVQNLNNQKPYAAPTKSAGVMMTEAVGTGLNYYNKLSKAQKTDLGGSFKWDSAKSDKLEPASIKTYTT